MCAHFPQKIVWRGAIKDIRVYCVPTTWALKVVSNGTGGGGVSGINRSALISSTFPQIQKKFFKGPGPLKNKKRF